MALDPRRGTPGTIAGFDSITLADGSVINEANFSIDQLRALLSSLQTSLSVKAIRSLEQQMLRHMADTNNPHQVTLSQLDNGDVGQILKRFVPGTTPRTFPVVAVEAVYEDGPQILSSISVARTTGINVIDRQGYLQYFGPNTSAVDWSLGYPVIPCWSQKTQYISDTTMLSNTTITATGCTKNQAVNSGVTPIMSTDQTDFIANGGQGIVKCSIASLQITNELTASVFLYPSQLFGSYYISTAYGSVVFDILTKSIIYCDAGVIGHIHTYPNGWWRIGIQVQPGSNPSAFVYDVGYTSRVYANGAVDDAFKTFVAVDGITAFTAFGPQITSGPGMAPFTPDSEIAQTTLSIPGFSGAMSTASGIIGVSFSDFPSLVGATETILAIDNGFNITSATDPSAPNQRTITATIPIASPAVTIASTNTYTSPADEIDFAVSYALSGLAARASGAADRTSISGFSRHFQSLGTATTITVGPFNGGMQSISLYSFPDDGRTLEFIIGEDT